MKLQEKIGEGLTSEVWRIEEKGQLFAMKRFKDIPPKMKQREIQILNSLKHPNVISIKEYDPQYEWYKSELMTRDLFGVVSTLGALSAPTTKQVLLTLATTLDFMHKLGYVHRDIKLDNVMINKALEIKIIDFGLTVLCHDDHIYTRHCGTPMYMAPELNLKEAKIPGSELRKTDVFALAILVFSILYGHPPFESTKPGGCPFWNAVCQGKWQTFWNAVDRKVKRSDEGFRSLMQGMLEPKPENRYTLTQVLNDPWIDDNHNLIELNGKI